MANKLSNHVSEDIDYLKLYFDFVFWGFVSVFVIIGTVVVCNVHRWRKSRRII